MSLRPLAILALSTSFGLVACDAGNKTDAKAPAGAAAGKAPAAGATAAAGTDGKGVAAKAPTSMTPGLAGTASKPGKPGPLPFEATGPVARIDGVDIPAERFNKEVRKMASRMPPGMAGRYKDRILDMVVTDSLVEKAFVAEKIEVEAAAVEAEFAKFAKEVSVSGPGGLKGFFAQAKTNEAEMKERMRKSLTFVALLAKKGHDVKVSDADAKKFYGENTERFTEKEQVKASHILLKVEAGADAAKTAAVEKQAKEIAAKAKAAGADFAALAKAHSQGPSGPQGGDLGFFEKSKMVPPFANAAWTMKKGDVSDPVKTRFGYHVIKVMGRKTGGQMKFDDVKVQIVAQLENDKRRVASKAVVEALTKASKVERLPANIKVNAAASPMGGLPGGLGSIPGLTPRTMRPKGLSLGAGKGLKMPASKGLKLTPSKGLQLAPPKAPAKAQPE